MRFAIIDMGTNTFNLLVAELDGERRYKTIHNSKCGVKLGEGGIDKKFIAPAAWERGLKAIETHVQTAKSYNVDKVFAFATSATRDAKNGVEFVDEIFQKYQVKVSVIEGEREAFLIYLGVRQAVDLGDEVNLVLDIGGGSNELILCNAKEVFWKHSFNLGIQRLLNLFNPSDPITNEQVNQIEAYLEKELQSLIEASERFKPVRLVGSSGTFDTYRSLLSYAGNIPLTDEITEAIPLQDYIQLHQILIKSNRDERVDMKGMELIRVDFIVLASVFTHFIIDRLGIKQIIQSNYALKEGALWELLQQENND